MGIFNILASPDSPGLEAINLEFILKLKIKNNDWLLADTWTRAREQPTIELYFDLETVLNIYNLEARVSG